MIRPFEKMFDLNRDGKLDVAEKAMMYDFLSSTERKAEDPEDDFDELDDDAFDVGDDFDSFDD